MAIEIQPGKCWSCGHPYDRAAVVDDSYQGPNALDVSVCASCGTLAVYEPRSKRLRRPTHEELRRLLNDRETTEKIALMQDAVYRANRERNG